MLTPTASSKIIVWADFALARRQGNFGRLFFTPIFPWAGRPGPAPGPARRAVDPGRARPRLHRAPPWTIGVVHSPPRRTRLLTRHLEEVWFPSHACHALLSSLFSSLFAGKREVGPKLKGKGLGTHQMVAHSAASQSWETGDSEAKKRRAENGSKRPGTQKSLGVSHCGPPPPRQATGDLTRVSNLF